MTGVVGEIRIVLDTSAIVAYANTSIAVGETIAEVVDEGGRFAVPIVCLAEAARILPEDRAAVVTLLTEHPAAHITPLGSTDWQVLAEWTRILGRVDAASALIQALHSTAWVMSSEPKLYGADDMPVIPI